MWTMSVKVDHVREGGPVQWILSEVGIPQVAAISPSLKVKKCVKMDMSMKLDMSMKVDNVHEGEQRGTPKLEANVRFAIEGGIIVGEHPITVAKVPGLNPPAPIPCRYRKQNVHH